MFGLEFKIQFEISKFLFPNEGGGTGDGVTPGPEDKGEEGVMGRQRRAELEREGA